MTSSSASRLTELDGLRGIAALTVVFGHSLLVEASLWDILKSGNPPDSWASPMRWLLDTPLVLAISGSVGVMAFFLLSGFALSHSFGRMEAFGYLPYLTKRIFRIWTPFAVAVLLSAAGAALFAHSTDHGRLFQAMVGAGSTRSWAVRKLTDGDYGFRG